MKIRQSEEMHQFVKESKESYLDKAFSKISDKFFTLKRISVRYSGDAYSFQCGMQSLIWGEWNIITLVRNAVANMGWKWPY